ncbi:MAG: VanZ family protein [Gemmatimonadetes bacterium]|nr:VanZ family protein [Gemmatimonadota bacterium]
MSRTAVLAFRAAFVALLVAATWLSLTPSPIQLGPSDKLDHLAAYFVLALAADFSFPMAGYLVRKGAPLFLYGLLMEVLQRYVLGRTYEVWDLAANATGLMIYALVSRFLKRLTSPRAP